MIPAAGTYTFKLDSLDSSALFIDGATVINNTGLANLSRTYARISVSKQ